MKFAFALALAIGVPAVPGAIIGFALVGIGTAVLVPLAFSAGANLGQCHADADPERHHDEEHGNQWRDDAEREARARRDVHVGREELHPLVVHEVGHQTSRAGGRSG